MNVVRHLPLLTCGLRHSWSAPSSFVSTSLAVSAAHMRAQTRCLADNKQETQTKQSQPTTTRVRHCITCGTTTNNRRPRHQARGTMLNPCSFLFYKQTVTKSWFSFRGSPIHIRQGHTLNAVSRVGCWQTRHVVQHLRKSCSFTEPRQSVGGFVARARMCFASSSSMPKLSNAKAISAASAPHERSG